MCTRVASRITSAIDSERAIVFEVGISYDRMLWAQYFLVTMVLCLKIDRAAVNLRRVLAIVPSWCNLVYACNRRTSKKNILTRFLVPGKDVRTQVREAGAESVGGST